jgi:guanyl-specific ribonuclease Sa
MKQHREIRWWVGVLLVAGGMLCADAVSAQDGQPDGAAAAAASASGADGSARAAAPKSGKRVCVNAELNGAQALSYDCLSQQLAPTPTETAGSVGNPAEAQVKAPSNQVGTFNYSAESIRFGNQWGKSVTPQRPAPTPVVPLK